MSNYYEDVYQKRLNRYGLDYQSRVQGARERDFENYLLKTVYRVDFAHNGKLHPGSLEHYKQDYSETQSYLLTRRDLVMSNGTLLDVISQDGTTATWMVWWKENVEASGYNRYVLLKMTHLLEWGKNKQWAFFSGPGKTAISDSVRTGSGAPVYLENNNLHTFITPLTENLTREDYFEITQGKITQGFTVSEFDIHSTPGVVYVTVDPAPLRETSSVLEVSPEDKQEDVYWLGGVK